MKKKLHVLVFVLQLCGGLATAQTVDTTTLVPTAWDTTYRSPQKPFVKLKTGELIEGTTMKHDEDITNESLVIMDGVTYHGFNLLFVGDNQGRVYTDLGLRKLYESVHINRDRNI